MNLQIFSSNLSKYEQSLMDLNPLASQIIPLLEVFKNRIRSEASWRVYQQDIKHFIGWLATESIVDLADINMDDMYTYHAHLRHYRYGPEDEKSYSNATINRMFTVSRRLLGILAEKKLLINPCLDLDIKKMAVEDETTHIALDKQQAAQLLAQIDTKSKKGKRDYALVSLLMRTGLRRNEARMLNIGDLSAEQGHIVATIHHGKGDKPGYVKIPVDVWQDIQAYQECFSRIYNSMNAPLFVSFKKGDKVSLREGKEARIDVKGIEALVKDLGRGIGIPDSKPLTPHGLRATFITLALENGATLEQTQYAARHKDSRITQRYRKRKLNLNDNAVDKLSFLAREVDHK